MSNSPLVSFTRFSPNNSGERVQKISRITPHCIVGQMSVENLGAMFSDPSVRASSNYGIGPDGRIGLYVPEDKRSWCSSSGENDQRAVTIECASDSHAPYAMRDVVYESLVKLCIDVCRRNGKNRLSWYGDKKKTLSHIPDAQEMVLTVHRWFANKACPGDWLFSRLGELAETVTKELDIGRNALYRVQVGAFHNQANAIQFRDRVRAAGFSDAFVVRILPYK